MVFIKRKWMITAGLVLFAMGGFSLYLYGKSIEGSEPFIEIEAEFVEARCDIVTRSSGGKASSTKFGNPVVVYSYAVDGSQFTSQRVFRTKFYPFGSIGECEQFISNMRSKRKFLIFADRSNPKLSFIDKSLPWPTMETIFLACGLAFFAGSLSFKKFSKRD